MDSVKNRGRNKFYSCFNPIVEEDEPCFHSPPPPSDAGEIRRRNKSPHHSISGFVKAVFFKTPLLKKLRMSKRSKRDSYRSSSNISSKIKKLTKKKKTPSPEEVYFQDNSDRSSLFSSTSSSSRASSISSNSSSGSERIKACLDSNQTSTNFRQHAMKLVSGSKCDCRGLMFIVLVCLVALVFWGKAFAIVTCTSAWLFLAPGRAGPQVVGPRAINVVDSEEYKKRVIMEGLLERNIRSRVVQ